MDSNCGRRAQFGPSAGLLVRGVGEEATGTGAQARVVPCRLPPRGWLPVTVFISALYLQLLGTFQLVLNHQAVPVTIGSQRLIAFLALHDRLLPRMYIAGVLWPMCRPLALTPIFGLGCGGCQRPVGRSSTSPPSISS